MTLLIALVISSAWIALVAYGNLSSDPLSPPDDYGEATNSRSRS